MGNCHVRLSGTDIERDRDFLAEDLSIVKSALQTLLDGYANGSITELSKVMEVLENLQAHLE